MIPFLALEGIDGVGKTTQCRLLEAALRDSGLSSCTLSLHDLTGFDHYITSGHAWVSADEELEFFEQQWQRYIEELIRPALSLTRKYDIVVSDRYLLSFLAYQSVVAPTRANFIYETLKKSAPLPHKTIILRPWQPISSQRVELSEPKLASLLAHRRQELAADKFLEFSGKPGYYIVSNQVSQESVHREIWELIQPLLVTIGTTQLPDPT